MSDEHGALPPVLRRASAPAEVQRRIAERAFARMRGGPSARRRWLWGGVGLAGAAAAVLLVLWLAGAWSRPAPERPRLAREPEKTVPASTEWVARKAPRAIAIGPHRAELAPGSGLRLEKGTPRSPRLRLTRGRALFSVKPLHEGNTFEVQTPQARVSVLGTRFSVVLDPRCTRVSVFAGRVRVTPARGEVRTLEPGQQGSFCEPPPSELDQAGREVRRAISLINRGEELSEAEAILTRYLAGAPSGTYAEEAHYFLVLVKRRLGKQREAVAQAQTFVERFPNAPRAATLRRWLEKEPH